MSAVERNIANIISEDTSRNTSMVISGNAKIVQNYAAAVLLQRRKMRDNLETFIIKAFSTYEPGVVFQNNWHIGLISEYLQACWKRELRKVIFNLPPRFLKSFVITISFPAWGLGDNPSERFVCTSYSAPLSKDHSVYCRNIMESGWYRETFPETIISSDQNEKSHYNTTKGGHRIATSVGGSTLGRGGNVQIMDDPMDVEKSLSETEREKSNRYRDKTWTSRKNDPKKSVDIIAMQRVHTDDTTGHVLSKPGNGFTVVSIPQVAPAKTTITFPITGRIKIRQKGELIHEKRFGADEVKSAKIDLGSFGFSAQQQQNPKPLKGGRIKLSWFPRYKLIPVEFDEVVFSLDSSQKDKEINDPSALLILGRVGSKWYIIDIWCERVNYPTLKITMVSKYNKYKPQAFLIEDKSSGQSLIQEFRAHTSIPVVDIEPEASKITRMDVRTPLLESGLISLPDPEYNPDCEWLSDFEDYMIKFPDPGAWDVIDALSQFLKWTESREQTLRVW